MNKFMKSSQGFTLIEVLLAIVILSILIVPVFNFFVQSMQYSKFNQQKTVATYAARNALVYLENVNFDAYKTFFDTNKDADSKQLEIIDPVLFCDGTLFTNADLTKLFPIINPDGSIKVDEEQSKLKCRTIFNPQINDVDYKILMTLKEYEQSEITDAASLNYIKNRIIVVEIKTSWFADKWQTELMRGFISHEEFRNKQF